MCDIDGLASTGTVGKRESILICARGGYTYWAGSLRAGSYVIIPFSTSFWHSDKENRDFTIVIHSSIQLELISKHRSATFLADCIISAAMKDSKKKKVNLFVFLVNNIFKRICFSFE